MLCYGSCNAVLLSLRALWCICSLDVIDSSKQWNLMADEGVDCQAYDSRAGHGYRDGLLCMSGDNFTLHT